MFKNVTRKNQTPVSKALALPAPTGGLNDLDPLASMEPGFMIDCMDVWPNTGTVDCRPGYKVNQETLGAPIKSFLGFVDNDGTIKKFAVTDSGIYDITIAGTSSLVYSDITNGVMGYVNFTTPAGNYLIAWNGVDDAAFYDGTSWAPFVQTATPAGVGQVDGMDPADISWVSVHLARLWFIEKNTMNIYYLPIDQMGGVLSPMFVGSNFNKGGSLLAALRWSSDTGRGLDDRFVMITTQGEIASFSGSDPASADTWTLDSSFYLAPPLGPRAVSEYGGDILILSRRGLVPVSSLLYGTATEVMQAGTLSRRINRAIQRLTVNWQSLPFPVEVFVHVEPMWITIQIWDTEANRPLQYVMNIITGAWGKFSYPIRTIHTIDNTIYMGDDDGRVLEVTPLVFVDNVALDNTGGVPIEPYVFSAYSYLDNPTVNKHAKFLRLIMKSQVRPSYAARVLSDFRTDQYFPAIGAGVGVAGAPLWDVALWDVAVWPTTNDMWLPLVSANVLGYAFAWQWRASTKVDLRISAAELIWEEGGLV